MAHWLATLAQQSSGPDVAAAVIAVILFVIYIAILVLIIAGFWKTFSKAGQPGWACIIPFVNMYFLCKIAGRPGWWVILMLIPFVQIVIIAVISIDVAKSFGKGVLFGIGLWLLSAIFYPILGFGSAEYQGPAAVSA